MIRIVRGPEPQGVIDAREENLSRALLEARHGGPEEVTGYGVARPWLHERQFAKCAYCESWERDESQPVEHYRPKGRPSRIDWSSLEARPSSLLTSVDEDRFARGLPPNDFGRVRWPDPKRQQPPELGYWWLAWTWENLVFGCQSCNGGSRKGTRFPLVRGSRALGERDVPPGQEQPLLIDPTDPALDPMDVIRFVWDGKHWRPVAFNDDPRAAWTIATLGLDGPSLLGLYRAKVEQLEQMARAFRSAVAVGASSSIIDAEWKQLCEVALAPTQNFLALTHDWLAHTFNAEIHRFGFTLSRPHLCHSSSCGPVTQQPPLPHRTELDGLPEALQYRIRLARHFREREIELRRLLVDWCRERPSTTSELIQLIGRETTLPGHLEVLRREGALTFDPGTERWMPPAAPATPS